MANITANTEITTDEHGNEVHTLDGEVVKIVNPRGKEFVAKNLGAKADAALVKRVEDFRWANQMTVAELVLAAVESYISE